MYNWSIRPELHIRIWIGQVTSTTLLLSILDSICIKYDTKILFALSTDTSIHIQCLYMSVESGLNYIFVTAEMIKHLPSCYYCYWRAYMYNMILKFSCHCELRLVFTLKLYYRQYYQFSTTYSYLDRLCNISQAVSIFAGQHNYKIH